MSSHASCIGCSGLPTLAARPSIVVTWSVGSRSPTGVQHGLNFLPLMWLEQAWQTPMTQPYFGTVTPRRSRRTHSSRTSLGASTLTRLPLRMNEWVGIAVSSARLLGGRAPGLALPARGGPRPHPGPLQAVGRRLGDRRLGRERREVQRRVVVDRELSRHLARGAPVGDRR